MASQNGSVPGNKASTPFSTAAGKPVVNDDARGVDFTDNPTGGGDKTPPENHATESRKQPAPDATTPPNVPWLRSRPQPTGSAGQRVDPASIPAGGITTKADPGPASRALGAQSTPRPFKNLK